jgi:hypothetical protein
LKKRSKQNNPEQKTKNAERNLDTEFGEEYNPVKEVKKKNAKRAQPVKSKNRELENK